MAVEDRLLDWVRVSRWDKWTGDVFHGIACSSLLALICSAIFLKPTKHRLSRFSISLQVLRSRVGLYLQ